MIYPFLRFFAIPIAFVLWMLYQLTIKRKPWSGLKDDVLVGGTFAIIVMLLFLFLSK